jgi:hypothetical protein
VSYLGNPELRKTDIALGGIPGIDEERDGGLEEDGGWVKREEEREVRRGRVQKVHPGARHNFLSIFYPGT